MLRLGRHSLPIEGTSVLRFVQHTSTCAMDSGSTGGVVDKPPAKQTAFDPSSPSGVRYTSTVQRTISFLLLWPPSLTTPGLAALSFR